MNAMDASYLSWLNQKLGNDFINLLGQFSPIDTYHKLKNKIL